MCMFVYTSQACKCKRQRGKVQGVAFVLAFTCYRVSKFFSAFWKALQGSKCRNSLEEFWDVSTA